MHEQMSTRYDGEKFKRLPDVHQGFVDQFGAFLTRTEAYTVAKEAAQLGRPGDGRRLYSEDIY
jgi:hypothetical protein